MEHIQDIFYDFLCKKHPFNPHYPIYKGVFYDHCGKYADNCEDFEYNLFNRVCNFFKRRKL